MELMKIHNLFLFLCSQKKEGSGNKNSWVEGDNDEEEEEQKGERGETVEYHRA